MSADSIEDLLEQQRELIAAITAVKNQLDASEWRRKCIWSLKRINAHRQRLTHRLPQWKSTITEMVDALECFAHLTFNSSDDLRIVFISFGLVEDMLEEIEGAENPSRQDLWPAIRAVLAAVRPLENGDPPMISAKEARIRDIMPEIRDAEREAVKVRFEQRLETSIREGFARRKAEREKDY